MVIFLGWFCLKNRNYLKQRNKRDLLEVFQGIIIGNLYLDLVRDFLRLLMGTIVMWNWAIQIMKLMVIQIEKVLRIYLLMNKERFHSRGNLEWDQLINCKKELFLVRWIHQDRKGKKIRWNKNANSMLCNDFLAQQQNWFRS